MLAHRFVGAQINIYPPISNSQGILIIGGNHHIRLLDYNQNCCFVIHKDGFDDTFLKYFMISAIIFDLYYTLFPECEYVLSGFRAVGVWIEEKHSIRAFSPIAEGIFQRGERGNIFNLAPSGTRGTER